MKYYAVLNVVLLLLLCSMSVYPQNYNCQCNKETFLFDCSCLNSIKTNAQIPSILPITATGIPVNSNEDLNPIYIEQLSIVGIPINNLSFSQNFSNLYKLSIKNSSITNIDENTFKNVSVLTELSIENNELKTGLNQTFDNNPGIYDLTLRNNSIQNIYPYIFHNLDKLVRCNMEENKLEEVDSKLFARNTKLEYLSLGNNKIKVIHEGAFNNLVELKILDLKFNELQELPNGIFDNLKKLNIIRLQNNKLTFLEEKIFINFIQIEKIHLENNKLQELPNTLFHNLSKLKVLYLQNNKIKILEGNIFMGCLEIEEINLTQNKIHSISNTSLQDLSSLMEINLNINEIQDVPDGLFANLHNIKTINLENNRISKITGKIFTNLPLLENIYLNENNISEIDSQILTLPRIQTISMADSFLKCDCKIKEFYAKYQDKKISGIIQCSDNKALSDLNESDLTCNPNIISCCTKSENDISCSVYGDPIPTIQWKINNTVIYNNSMYNIQNNYAYPYVVVSNLRIFSKERNTTEIYQFEAQNLQGITQEQILKEKMTEVCNNKVSGNNYWLVIGLPSLIILIIITVGVLWVFRTKKISLCCKHDSDSHDTNKTVVPVNNDEYTTEHTAEKILLSDISKRKL